MSPAEAWYVGRSARELKVSPEAEHSAVGRGSGTEKAAGSDTGGPSPGGGGGGWTTACFIPREAGASLQSFQWGVLRIRWTPLPHWVGVAFVNIQQMGSG